MGAINQNSKELEKYKSLLFTFHLVQDIGRTVSKLFLFKTDYSAKKETLLPIYFFYFFRKIVSFLIERFLMVIFNVVNVSSLQADDNENICSLSYSFVYCM